MFGSKIRLGEPWAEKEISRYETFPVEKGRILLYGDSLFTRCSGWCGPTYGNPDIEKELLGKDGRPAVLNRGFGGSCTEDQLYYYGRMVLPYEPRALVLSGGGNDFDQWYRPEEVLELQGRLVDYVQADLPGIPIFIFSQQPHVREEGKQNHFTRSRNAYNELLDDYCAKKPGVTCLRIQDAEFLFNDPKDAGGYENLRRDIICSEDGVHFNALGYKYFIEYLREALDALL